MVGVHEAGQDDIAEPSQNPRSGVPLLDLRERPHVVDDAVFERHRAVLKDIAPFGLGSDDDVTAPNNGPSHGYLAGGAAALAVAGVAVGWMRYRNREAVGAGVARVEYALDRLPGVQRAL